MEEALWLLARGGKVCVESKVCMGERVRGRVEGKRCAWVYDCDMEGREGGVSMV